MLPPRLAIEAVGPHRLPVLRRGPARERTVVFVQPLFEELNRCRRLFRDIGTALAEREIASALPDLPATGDHEDLGAFSLQAAREALSQFLGARTERPLLLSVRSGALLAPEGYRHLCISPLSRGDRILAEMIRAHGIGERERTGKPFGRADAEGSWAKGSTVTLTGYTITPDLYAALSSAEPGPFEAVEYDGPPVWRQADPLPTVDAGKAISAQIAAALANADPAT